MACWLGIALIFSAHAVRGQEFNYSVSTSTSTYTALMDTALCDTTSDWSYNTYIVPIGFSFSFEGDDYDTISIEPNGIIKFSPSRAIVAYHGARCKLDTANAYSRLSYNISGATGARIIKIQYAYCGYDTGDLEENLSYQVWLYEQDNKIEVHTGPNSYPGALTSTAVNPTPLIGLINPLQDGTVNALLLTGDAAAPVASQVGYGSPLLYLDYIPSQGKVYAFTPNGN